MCCFFFFSSRRRHTRWPRDWSSDVCSSDLIMRGVEVYRGRPIFHGLGNFVTVTRALSRGGDSPERRAWAERREKLFGFRPDPAMPTYPFHPERDRKSTRLNSSHVAISYAVFCLN